MSKTAKIRGEAQIAKMVIGEKSDQIKLKEGLPITPEQVERLTRWIEAAESIDVTIQSKDKTAGAKVISFTTTITSVTVAKTPKLGLGQFRIPPDRLGDIVEIINDQTAVWVTLEAPQGDLLGEKAG